MIYQLAIINEAECIGCTKCIQACPFDAIIGANKQFHTILKTECTGCGLCVDPCPVDCIEMIPVNNPLFNLEKTKLRRRAHRERMQEEKFSTQKDEITEKTILDIINRAKHKK
jgi:electron transport complex protein RnfB